MSEPPSLNRSYLPYTIDVSQKPQVLINTVPPPTLSINQTDILIKTRTPPNKMPPKPVGDTYNTALDIRTATLPPRPYQARHSRSISQVPHDFKDIGPRNSDQPRALYDDDPLIDSFFTPYPSANQQRASYSPRHYRTRHTISARDTVQSSEFPPIDTPPPRFSFHQLQYPSGNTSGTALFPEFGENCRILLRGKKRFH